MTALRYMLFWFVAFLVFVVVVRVWLINPILNRLDILIGRL